MAFNPVLQQIKLEEELIGYKIHTEKSTSSIVTLPYADDFCLVTTHMRTHQKYINKINANIKSMGMKLKPSKCRSFSICIGKAKNVPFHIDDNQIPSICEEDQKFLGKLLFFSGKSGDTFEHVKKTLIEALDNVDRTLIRNEYKLWILKNYLIPSKRYILTVHNLTNTQLSKLDTIANKYMKKWAGISKSATNVVIHLKEALDISSI